MDSNTRIMTTNFYPSTNDRPLNRPNTRLRYISGPTVASDALNNTSTIRKCFDGILVTNNRYDEMEDFGEGDLGKEYDAVAFGRAFLANPDLPARLVLISANSVWRGSGSTKKYVWCLQGRP